MGEAPDIRIGTAERERALALLSEHYSAGRLTLAEFEERTEVVLEARYQRDLDPVFADLPRPPAPLAKAQPLEPAPVGPAAPTLAPVGRDPERWRTTVMALTPFVALILFFVTKQWLFFLAVPIMGILLFGGKGKP